MMGVVDCLFCKIVDKKIPSKVVYEDPQAIAICDVNPQSPTHMLVIPKKHLTNLLSLQPEDQPLMAHLMSVVTDLARKGGLTESGFRTVINSGKIAGQTVFHLHIHLLGGRTFHWPPG